MKNKSPRRGLQREERSAVTNAERGQTEEPIASTGY
jgi:hypothetical protein